MAYKRILTVQDISCVGQCSGSVALPILSACGHECCLLPSAVLSTHTGGFTGYTFCDLTEEIPKIHEHWKNENIYFDCIYTGYLGSRKQIHYVSDIFADLLEKGGVKVVDPAMADNGKLYYGFDNDFVQAMAGLCTQADIILPNITEACFITGTDYQENYNLNYIMSLLGKLENLGCRCVVLTGVSFKENSTGVAVFENGQYSYYEHQRIKEGCHGTGDVYASAFTGALMQEKTVVEASRIAADYTVECIKATREDDERKRKGKNILLGGRPGHWYGVEFERKIGYLMERVL